MPSLQDLIATAPGVSARPDSVAALMDVIDDPLVAASTLLPVIERDPGLTAGLLKLCNSSLYNLKRIIGTPREALVMVGNVAFARLCFTLSLEPALQRELPGYQLDLGGLWQHSLATAYGSSFLVSGMGRRDLSDRAFTAGLLHDIGKLVLDQALVGGGDPLAPTPGESRGCDLERRRTGYDHAEAGAALLDSWNLPEEIVAAVRWHHEADSAGDHQRLAHAVEVADRVSHIAVKLHAGSQAVEDWVSRTFDGAAFAKQSVRNLAEILATKHQNILALAMNPRI
ncbi:MAG: HDOD domain-containing protein [Candidatus Krumholzibacteriia bacterium]